MCHLRIGDIGGGDITWPLARLNRASRWIHIGNPGVGFRGCLFLDARMPGMTGVDLLRHLAATGSRIPVIMLTARGDDETRWRSLEAKDLAST